MDDFTHGKSSLKCNFAYVELSQTYKVYKHKQMPSYLPTYQPTCTYTTSSSQSTPAIASKDSYIS